MSGGLNVCATGFCQAKLHSANKGNSLPCLVPFLHLLPMRWDYTASFTLIDVLEGLFKSQHQ